MPSRVCVMLLAVIAAMIAVRQTKAAVKDGGLTWALIALYWIINTVKYLFDLLG